MRSELALDVQDLSVSLPEGADRREAVSGLTCDLRRNEILCVVGESGSGKSVFARSILGLLPVPKLKVTSGKILFEGTDLRVATPAAMRKLRGCKISMIFQEPMTALNPLMRIDKQMEEVLKVHTSLNKAERRDLMTERLVRVGILDPQRICRSYPHELSGGQRQRAMIATALLLQPSILIADEPTTALDVTTQAKIIRLIKDTQLASGMAVIFITHDFGVVAELADRVAVMEKGKLVELGAAKQVLERPAHPYTQALIGAVPKMIHRSRGSTLHEGPTVLEASRLQKIYASRGRVGKGGVAALRSVSISIKQGETLGIVGESGSGKSTLARCIARLINSDSGTINLQGTDLATLSARELRIAREKFQMVFQDPFASLDPRWKVGRLIAEGLLEHGRSRAEATKRSLELLSLVGLKEEAAERFPHEFSGGQRQRIAIARALALEPKLLIADEPVSALDVSVQAQILILLAEIKARVNLAMLFITHDLRVAAQVCDRVCVMKSGEIVEEGYVDEVFSNPKHPYTAELLNAVPGLAKEKQVSGHCLGSEIKASAALVAPKHESVPGVDGELFKQTMRQWAAGVTVITVGSPPHCHGMTANSFTPLSRNPPLMLICIDRKNDTHKLLSIGSRFGINLLSDAQAQLSQQFASKAAGRDRFDGLAWYPGPCGATLFQACAAVMEAEVVQLHEAGDHTIFVGKIISAKADSEKSALLYSRGSYARLIEAFSQGV